MTRRALIAPSLAALAFALSAAALAGEPKFDVGGFSDGAIFDIEQDSAGFADSDRSGIDALANAELHLRGSYLTENGTELGARIELRLQSGARSDSTTGTDDLAVVDRAFLWAESGLGRVELGATDGIASQLQVEPPSITKSMRIDHPLMMPVADGQCAYYRPAGLMLRTDPYASDQSAKIVYRSPRLFGLQAGISYTPEFSANLERFVKAEGDDLDQQSNIFEFGLNYDSTLDDVRLRADLVYLMAENELPSDTTSTLASPWLAGDLSEWGGALNVEYQGFTIGGAYRHSNARGGFVDHAPVVLTGGASDTELWSVGALYEFESWKLGANYISGEANVAVENPAGGAVATQESEAWQFAAAYVVDADIQIAVGYQGYRFNAAAGLNPLGLAEFRPVGIVRSPYVGDLEADILFAEFSIGF